jgi:hypothetical protein
MLVVDLFPFVSEHSPERMLRVSVNGYPVGERTFKIGQPREPFKALVPRSVLERLTPVRVTLQVPDPVAPASVSNSIDNRRLGIMVQRIALRPQ